MNHLVVHVGMAVGFAFVVFGSILALVGVSRYLEASWPDRFVRWWDRMWTRRFAAIFFPICVIAIFIVAFFLDARAQGVGPIPPISSPPAPPSNTMTAPNSGGGAIIQGSPNIGRCSPLGANSPSCNNYAPKRLEFNMNDARDLLRQMPNKKKGVQIYAEGEKAEWDIAGQFANFLNQEGYFINFTTIGRVMDGSSGKISVRDNGDVYLLTIRPSSVY